MATGFGLKLVGTTTGKEAAIHTYYIPSTDGTALHKGQVVELTATGALDPTGQVPTIKAFSTGEILLGVVVGFEPDATNLLKANYRQASTNRYVLVCDDPDAIYHAQEDAVGGSVSAANIGSLTNCALISAAGSSVTGLSGTMVDSSQVTASAADVKIIGVARNADNVGAQSGGAVLVVKLLSSAVNATDSQT